MDKHNVAPEKSVQKGYLYVCVKCKDSVYKKGSIQGSLWRAGRDPVVTS